MNVLIVYAHPEPKSFNRALLDRSVEVLREEGRTVQVSDLYAMRFNPVASDADFTQRRFPGQMQYDREQKHASQHGAFAADIQSELGKLLWCDFLILQFPLWWFSVPAIMKGWIDRVFVNGTVYGNGKRFDTGGLKGRKAMLAISTGCYPEMVEPDGLLGPLDTILWHLHHGTFAYSGIAAVPPFMSWSIQYTTPERREQYLSDYAQRMRELAALETMYVHPLSDFGADWRLKPGVEPRTAGHRRPV
ncbi:MAG: NAD(P)H-dependent oxidoreductase [Burkholderiaceae bacterium]|nr:NAD(P)H-dependent oxidoreductase [Burkholderiaceae bacterium]